MPVIAIQSHDLHLTDSKRSNAIHPPANPVPKAPTLSNVVREYSFGAAGDSLAPVHSSKNKPDSTSEANPPTPVSPPSRSSSPVRRDDGGHYDVEPPEAGPSNSSASRIPPPPTPRRHRSGVLMSRVRAKSGGGALPTPYGMSLSKSWGDFRADLGMRRGSGTSADEGDTDEADFAYKQRDRSLDGKRIFSEGSRSNSEYDGEESIWDNSARYYHHLLHSRPASRAASRATSPERSSVTSTHQSPSAATSASASPIFARRSLAPINGPGPPGAGLAASLSPNHHFLQQHLPPPFPSSISPEQPLHSPSMLIMTPTTEEWRELRELRRLETGEEPEDSSGGTSGSDDSRRSSLGLQMNLDQRRSNILGDLNLEGGSQVPSRPALQTTLSADYLEVEQNPTPEPGGSDGPLSPVDDEDVPTFNPNVIAPSPIAQPSAQVESVEVQSPTRPGPFHASSSMETVLSPVNPVRESLQALGEQSSVESSPDLEADPDQPLVLRSKDEKSPLRFNSIGRRDSLQAIRDKNAADRPGMPRVKTKRERERERLFRGIDEELEGAGGAENNPWGGVQVIGMGNIGPTTGSTIASSGGIGSRRGSLEPDLDEPKQDVFDRTFKITPAESTPTTSPTRKETFKDSTSTLNHGVPRSPTKSIKLSPTQPMRPSPLHADVTPVSGGLPTPETPDQDEANSEFPISVEPPVEQSRPPSPTSRAAHLDQIRDYARKLATPHPQHHSALNEGGVPSPPKSPKPTRARRRASQQVSLVAGRIVQPFQIPPSTSLPPPDPNQPVRPSLHTLISGTTDHSSLQSFSAFRSGSPSTLGAKNSLPPLNRLNSSLSDVSVAPSTVAPSECTTPTSDTAGGIGGRGIDDYVILKEAGKGAYGLVMRAKVKGPKGEPVGDEVIIKYIIKARILADCWKKHKSLGPIPVEIHVMDQLRHLLYNPPLRPHPWDPKRPKTQARSAGSQDGRATPMTPDSPRSDSSRSSGAGIFSPTQKYIASEIRHSPERGHPNICKLLDFFEDREFYYLVMPRFGTGVDLFDRVENQPEGLEPFEIRSLLGQLADAVRFIHSNGIVHRDIKDENVILDGDGHCQLIDFGSAAQWRPGKKWDTFSGTLHYASPEILRGEMYGGREQDIWALGVVGYVLMVGETPFSELPDEILVGLTAGSRAESALEERCGGTNGDEGMEADGGGSLRDAGDFVRRCLEMDPADRPSADILCQHRYLKGEGGWTGANGWIGMGFK